MKSVFTLIALMAILIVPIMSAYATTGSNTATGNVSIQGTCGVGVTYSSGTALSFGSVFPGQPVVASNNLVLSNTGATSATLTVVGTDWVTYGTDTTPPPLGTSEILATNTGYAGTATGPFKAIGTVSTPVTITGAFLGTVPEYFQLIPTLENPGYAGGLQQMLTFTAMC